MKRILILLFCFLLSACESESVEKPVQEEVDLLDDYFQIIGEAQGTTYSIIYQDTLQRDFSFQMDSILKDYDSYLSVYLDTSLITQFNNSNESPSFTATKWANEFSYGNKTAGLFEECFSAAKEIYKKTDGDFNPAIYPLVKYWGFFGAEINEDIKQRDIDSILKLVSFDDSMIYLSSDNEVDSQIQLIVKSEGNIKIDFNGIAQGHSVDVIANYLNSKGVNNYMVEIGGEVYCSGVNNKNTSWQIGVDKPVENSNPGEKGLQLIVAIDNKAIATSGNYRKFYEKDGVKYAHTLNPKTGFPVQHSLLSVTVVANKCVDADGYATAFMVMGMEEAKDFLESHQDLDMEVYLIASKNNSEYDVWMTEGFEKLINKY